MTEAAKQTNPDHVLRLERPLRSPPRRGVFAAWTDPAQLAKWWGPRGRDYPEM